MAPESRRWEADGMVYHTLKQRFGTGFRQFNDCHYFAFALQALLENCRADVVHCLNYFDAFAALRARRKFGLDYKVCFHAVGIPIARYFRSVPLDKWFMRETLANVDVTFALSRFACDRLESEFGCRAELLPPPVVVDAQLPARPAAGGERGPTLLFVGDLLEPRKGVLTLCRAFCRVKARYPDAELVLSGNVDEAFKRRVRALPGVDGVADSIHFYGLGKVESLRELYSRASVTVLPSVWEAFGLVMIESLAMGTPVVGTDHGGIGDIIDSPAIGRLFDPGDFDLYTQNSDALAAAILETLEIADLDSTARACHARALQYSWQQLGPNYESWYRRLTAPGRRT